MKLYFDSNIYGFISDRREDQAVYKFLEENGHAVEASSDNLFEIYHIPDQDKCKRALQTLTTVALFYEPKPQSWWQAQEVLKEIKRLRSHWIRQQKRQDLIIQEKAFLRSHKDNWKEAKDLYIPPSHITEEYRGDFEKGVANTKQVQKTLRQRLLENKLELTLYSQTISGETNVIITDELLDPESYWRINNLLVWFEAIARRNPSSRDYADWLLPYIREDSFRTTTPSYSDFWMKHVRADRVPKNRITSLVDFYQMKHKITHGNAGDQMHACHMFDVDIFVTADKAYYQVLCEVKSHFSSCARIVLLNRSGESVIDELRRSLV